MPTGNRRHATARTGSGACRRPIHARSGKESPEGIVGGSLVTRTSCSGSGDVEVSKSFKGQRPDTHLFESHGGVRLRAARCRDRFAHSYMQMSSAWRNVITVFASVNNPRHRESPPEAALGRACRRPALRPRHPWPTARAPARDHRCTKTLENKVFPASGYFLSTRSGRIARTSRARLSPPGRAVAGHEKKFREGAAFRVAQDHLRKKRTGSPRRRVTVARASRPTTRRQSRPAADATRLATRASPAEISRATRATGVACQSREWRARVRSAHDALPPYSRPERPTTRSAWPMASNASGGQARLLPLAASACAGQKKTGRMARSSRRLGRHPSATGAGRRRQCSSLSSRSAYSCGPRSSSACSGASACRVYSQPSP